jgi:hypothetical protein
MQFMVDIREEHANWNRKAGPAHLHEFSQRDVRMWLQPDRFDHMTVKDIPQPHLLHVDEPIESTCRLQHSATCEQRALRDCARGL